GGLVVSVAETRAVAGVGVAAIGVCLVAAGGAGILEAVVGAAAGSVAEVLVLAQAGAGTAGMGVRLVVGLADVRRIAGVRIAAFGVGRDAGGGGDGIVAG